MAQSPCNWLANTAKWLGGNRAEYKKKKCVEDHCPQRSDASRRLLSPKLWDSRGQISKTLALLKPEQAKEESSRWGTTAATQVNAENTWGAWDTRLPRKRPPGAEERKSPWGKFTTKMRPDSMSSQENNHCLLNSCSFSDSGYIQTQPAEAQPAAHHRGPETQRQLQECDRQTWRLYLGSAGSQNASEDTKGDLYFSFFNHDLSLLSLLLYGQWQ